MTKPEPKTTKYLLLDLEAATITVQCPNRHDLILKDNSKKANYSILENGVQIVEILHDLIENQDFKLVSHSQKNEKDQIKWFIALENACKEKNIKKLPSVAAIAVNDSSCFSGIKAEQPVAIKSRTHGIWVAGYDKEADGKTFVREALSKMLNIAESERKLHIIFDHDLTVVNQARLEGWQAHYLDAPSIKAFLKNLGTKENQYSESHLEEQKEDGEDTKADASSDLPLLSDKKFKLLEKEAKHGSSPSRGWYLDETSNTIWFGKCSLKGVGGEIGANSFDEYREYLANKLYSLFGVRTPQVTLSFQPLSLECLNLYLPGLQELHGPRIHLMSEFVEGFKELGENFVHKYLFFQPRDCYYRIEAEIGSVVLRGFGSTLAVSVLLHDYDCIGGWGANMGYIIQPNGFAEIVKIDPGEALSFSEDMSGASGLNNKPEMREVVIATSKLIIKYSDLNYEDKKEFAKTMKKILEIPDTQIEELFKPFLKIDKRFKKILESLLKRKEDLLRAYSGEIRVLLMNHLKDKNEEKARNLIVNWQKPSTLSSFSDEDVAIRSDLTKNRAYLEATVLSSQTLETTRMFQVPCYMKNFIGRKSELDKLKHHLSLSNQKLNHAAIVGLSGLGKTQLAIEYIRLNQDSYSDIIWLNAEHSSTIINQILMYLQVYRNIRLPLYRNEEEKIGMAKDKMCLLETCAKSLYQSFARDDVDKKKKICIVLDNAQTMEDSIKYLLAPSVIIDRSFDILITSSYQKWEEPITKIVPLQKFSSEEVREYVFAQMIWIPDKKDAIYKFADLLDGLPLVVAQAVAYLQQTNLTLTHYMARLEEFQSTFHTHLSLLDLLDEKTVYIRPEEEEEEASKPDPNEDLFKVQLKKLSQADFSSIIFSLSNIRELSKCADSILGVLAYLSADYITKSMLQDCWYHCSKQFQDWMQSDQNKSYQEQFEQSLELLMAHSFITVEDIRDVNMGSRKNNIESNFALSKASQATDKLIKVNNLTQSMVRLIHHKNGLFDGYYENVFEWVLQQLEYDRKKLDEIKRVRWIVPHGIILSKMKSEIDDSKHIELLNKIGSYQLYSSGEYEEAFNPYKRDN